MMPAAPASRLLSALAIVLVSVEARGDGGAVLARQWSGPFAITVFGAAQPLVAGSTDLSVLVQDGQRGAPILDADVTLQLSPPATAPDTAKAIAVALTHEQATNKLLYAAPVEISVPGTWTLQVEVHHDGVTAQLGAELSVGHRVSGLRTIWPHLLLPPVVLLLFGLHQSLARRRA